MIVVVDLLAITTVDLARLQFATTSLYHFLFVPLTLGLAPLVAVMQTLWYRGGDEAWLRLARFFGTLMLINFAIGVATGLVQEFQFGMNWSVYSEFVGDVFGAPLAIEGLAAFMLESTFLGLWIFGWDRLSKRVHLATIWLFALGAWMSAFFIIAANSWMQRPVGSTVTNGRAELTDVWELFSNRFGIWAYIHVLLVGLTDGRGRRLRRRCWHFVAGGTRSSSGTPRSCALIVVVPISAVNLGVGSQIGVVVTDYQPMKIASTEAQWDTCQPCAFSLFQIGGFTEDDQTPTFSIQIPHLLSFLATLSWDGEVQGLNSLQSADEAEYGAGDYIPPVRTTYWSMRIMAYAGTLVFLVFALGRVPLPAREARVDALVPLARRGLTIPLPYVATLAGWVLSEVGRQPWIVWGLLKTVDANSPSVSTATIAMSLGDVRRPLRRAPDRRLRPHAPLRARRSARGRRRGRRVRAPGGDLLMDLETFWFCLIAVVWAMYFLLEGFDFGVGMLLPFVPRDGRGAGHDAPDDRPGLGRERGLARRGRRRDLRGVPGLVRDDVLGLLPRAPAHALLPHRPRGLVRVALEERDARLARDVDVGEHDRQLRRRADLGGRAVEPAVRRPDRLRRRLRRRASWISSARTRVFAGVAVVLLFAFHGATFLTLRTTGELCERAERCGPEALRFRGRARRGLPRLDRRGRDRPQRQGRLPAGAARALGIAALALAVVFVFTGATGGPSR